MWGTWPRQPDPEILLPYQIFPDTLNYELIPYYLCLKLVREERMDHVILELINGSIRISYNTDTIISQIAYVGQALNDGRFHKVNLQLQNRKPFEITVSVDKTQSVTVQGTQPVDFRQVKKFYIGGLRTLTAHARKNLVTDKNFIGCIKVRGC